MPIQLTTPHTISPGHGAPAVECTHVKVKTIDRIDVENRTIRFVTWYGSGDPFVGVPGTEVTWTVRNVAEQRGVAPYWDPETETTEMREGVIVAEDLQFNQLSALAVSQSTGELGWDIVARALYQWLINGEKYAGAIT